MADKDKLSRAEAQEFARQVLADQFGVVAVDTSDESADQE